MKGEQLLREVLHRIDALAAKSDAAAMQAKDDKNQYMALVEDLDEKFKRVADGHMMLKEKIDNVAATWRYEMRQQRDELGTVIQARSDKLAADLRAEIRAGNAALREEIKAGDAALREEIKAGDAALRAELVTLRDEMRAGDAALHEELSEFRAETKGEFAELRRVARLETTVGDLAARVDLLERKTAQ